LINNDFGGLHLQRMGRNNTVQHLLRLTLLAPDWTESNIRTMVNAVAAGSKAERSMNQKFWFRTFMRTAITSVVLNVLMARWDDDEKEDESFISSVVSQYKDSIDNPGRLNWLAVDITPLYRLNGKGEDEELKYYFSILGHFGDPVKFILEPLQSAKNKGSVLSRTGFTVFEGTNWQGKRYTTVPEFLGVDDKGVYMTSNNEKGYSVGDPKGGQLRWQLNKWNFGGNKGALKYDEVPTFLLDQVRGWTPVPVQNAMAYLMGDIDAFDALTHGVGFHVNKARVQDDIEERYNEVLRDARLHVRMFNEAKNEHNLAKVVGLSKDQYHRKYAEILSIESKIRELEDAKKSLEDNGEFDSASKLEERISHLMMKSIEIIE